MYGYVLNNYSRNINYKHMIKCVCVSNCKCNDES